MSDMAHFFSRIGVGSQRAAASAFTCGRTGKRPDMPTKLRMLMARWFERS
jgi:hypothetical protein